MVEFATISFSGWPLVEALTSGIVLLVVFWLLHRVLDLIPRLRAQPGLHRILSGIEAIVWVAYAFWAIERIFVDSLYSSVATLSLLAVLGVLLAWFVIKDWVAGVVLRVQDVYESDQFLELGERRGRVTRLGHLTIEIEHENGDRVKIPYSRISGQIHSIHHPDALSNYYRFRIVVPRPVSVADASLALRTAILNTPWSSSNRPIRINLLDTTQETHTFEAVVYATRQSFAQSIEDAVRQEFPDVT
jgi:small-conductance mechanosensitive channel